MIAGMDDKTTRRRELADELSKAIMGPSRPVIQRNEAPLPLPEPAKPAAIENPPTQEAIEQRLIALLLGGEQNRRTMLQRIGSWIASASISPANALPAAGETLGMGAAEAANLYLAGRKASRTIGYFNAVYDNGGIISRLVFANKEPVAERVKLLKLDELMDVGFLDILDIRTTRSIKAMCDALSGIIDRERLNLKNTRALAAYMEKKWPGKDPYLLAHPEEDTPERAAKEKALAQLFPVRVAPRDFDASAKQSSGMLEILESNLDMMQQYLQHFTQGTLEEWADSRDPGSYESTKKFLEGPEYKARPRTGEAELEFRKSQLGRLLDLPSTHTKSTLGRGPQAHKIMITGAISTLNHIENNILSRYPDASISSDNMGSSIPHRERHLDIWQPRLVIENPPFALAVELEKHVKNSSMGQHIG